MISGLRLAQLATGSHYKVNGILDSQNVQCRDAVVAGDGSGGLSALILRKYPFSRIIFNSLCEYKNVYLKGSTPSPPSASLHTVRDPDRCVNLRDCWASPNDLRLEETWKHFKYLARTNAMDLDIAIFDMEVTDNQSISQIEKLCVKYIASLLSDNGVLIFKTYVTRLFHHHPNILDKAINMFASVEVVWTDLTSSQSSEVYLVMRGLISSKPGFQVYPQYETLWNDLKDSPSRNSDIKEYQRAIKIKGFPMEQGVPSILIVDKSTELMKLLNILGVRADLSYRLTHILEGTSSLNDALVLFFIVISYIIGLHLRYEDTPPIPSDKTVINLGSWISGFLMWFGFEVESYWIYRVGLLFIQKFFPFSYYTNFDNHYYTLHFSLIKIISHNKIVQLDSKMALIGSVIRSLRRFFPRISGKISLKSVNERTAVFNPVITCEFIEHHSGLIGILKHAEDYKMPIYDMTTINTIEPEIAPSMPFEIRD